MTRQRNTIKVSEVIGGNSAITREDGQQVYLRIDELLSQGIDVELDFDDIDFLITVFLNAAIGQLYKKYSSEYLNDHVELINLKSEHREHFRDVIEFAKKFFTDDASRDVSEQQLNQVFEDE